MAKRVLIADDDASVALLISKTLSKRGYETRVERDGDEALRAAGEWAPALVILDVMMPGMHGFAVCRSLKESAQPGGARVLILTAKPYDADRRLAAEAGADDYLTKPFDIEELIAKVAELTAEA